MASNDNMDKILFIESDLRLQSAISFSQYVIEVVPKRFKLVTLIGEIHLRKFSCEKDPQIPVSEYVLRTLRRNKQAVVLLEAYPPKICVKEYWSKIGSYPIREIMEKTCGNSLVARVKGYDWRRYFLGA